MSHRLTGRSVLMGITIIAGALSPGIAGAAPAAPAPTNLTLTVHQGADTRTAVLHCDPAGGDHPRATAACRELASIGGRLQELSSRRPERLCTMDYRPVTAQARGTWQGRPIKQSVSANNRCLLQARTGPVFDF